MIDAELREWLESNAAETRRQFEVLGQRMDARFEKIDARFESLEIRMASVEARLDTMATRDYVREVVEESHRHFEIVVEGLRHEVQILAEHILSNTESIARLEDRVGRLETRVDHLDTKIDHLWNDHEHRITKLEATSRR